MKHWLSAIAAITLVLVSAHGARAQEEITLIGPNIMRAPIEQLIPGFEAKTGHKVKATFGQEVGTRQQIMRGEADVPLVEAPDADVIASGSVVASSETAGGEHLRLASPCARARPSQTYPPLTR